MAESSDVLRWIRDLANVNPLTRGEGPHGLYLAGLNQCLPVLDQWKTDPEFSGLTKPTPVEKSDHAEAEKPRIIVGVAVNADSFEIIRAANNSPRLADVPPDQDAKE